MELEELAEPSWPLQAVAVANLDGRDTEGAVDARAVWGDADPVWIDAYEV